jgi:HlyD family secretion protein
MIAKIITFTVLAGVGFSGWRYTHKPIIEKYFTEPIERGEIVESVSATGTLNSTATIDVGAQVSGLITGLYADYNTPVHKGQVLALIDPGPFQAQLAESQAGLESARASVEAARSALDEAKEGVRIAQQQSQAQRKLADSTRSAAQLAKVEMDRSSASLDAGIINQDTFLTAKTAFTLADDDSKAADAQANSAALAIPEKQAEVESAQGNLDAALDQVKQSESAVQVDKVNLTHTEILSPVDGIVLNRLVSQGQTVASAAVVPVLFQVVKDLGTMQVDVNLDESNVSQVKPGQRATFTVDAFPGRTFESSVRQVREEATNIQNVISYDVVLDVLTKGVSLLPGMTANVRIITVSRPTAVKVPNSALRYKPDNAPAVDKTRTVTDGTVYVLENGVPVAQHIIIGITDGRFTEVVSSNLQPGEPVVVSSSHTT